MDLVIDRDAAYKVWYRLIYEEGFKEVCFCDLSRASANAVAIDTFLYEQVPTVVVKNSYPAFVIKPRISISTLL